MYTNGLDIENILASAKQRIESGGPGSGRKPDSDKMLQRHGWSFKGKSMGKAVILNKVPVYTYKNPDFQDHRIDTGVNNTWWTHIKTDINGDLTRVLGNGKGLASLEDHLVKKII